MVQNHDFPNVMKINITNCKLSDENSEIYFKDLYSLLFQLNIGNYTIAHKKMVGGADAEVFRNRKGKFSINVQVVCNARLKIQDIVANWGGSTHDATIFNNSLVKTKFENGDFRNLEISRR